MADLAELAHDAFQGSSRRSLTSGLTRSLLAVHTVLVEENLERADGEQSLASGVAAALRPSGLYVAQMGDGLFGNTRLGTLWARAWEADEGALEIPGDEPAEALPRVTTEFFPIGPGDAFLLLPGLTGGEAEAGWLSAALGATPDLDAIGELLSNASAATAGLVVWWPPEGLASSDRRWISWASAPFARQPTAGEVPVRAAPVVRPPDEAEAAPGEAASLESAQRTEIAEGTESAHGTSVPEGALWGPAQPPLRARLFPGGLPTGRPFLLGVTALLGIALLAVLAVVRNAAPDTAVDEGGALIGQAESSLDRDFAVAKLDEAIARLQPRSERDQKALSLLARAQSDRDRVLDIVRVGEIERFGLPSADQRRPLGIWKGENSLFILDIGQQLLYRTDVEGARLEVALKPGDAYADQPVGSIVGGAWSPPQGVNTDGRLMLVDTARSVLSISPSGTRRWWPPDSDQWAQIGPTAATFESFFLLDSGRGLVWQYPARVALARATTAATSRDEPRLSQAIDMATDGNLYFLFPDGSIRKMAVGGGALPFEGKVPGQPLLGPVAVFAHPDFDRVWVLDPPASRVVEFTSGGAYSRQYVFPPNVIRQGAGLQIDPVVEEMRVLTSEHVLSVKMRPGGTAS